MTTKGTIRGVWKVAARAVRGFLIMVHPVPVLCVLSATAAFALFVRYPSHPPTLLRLVGAMACLQAAIGALNDYVDLPLDRRTKPWKPLVRGDLRPGTALWLAVGGVALGLWIAAPLGALVAALALLGTGAAMIYNLYLKTTAWSWLPYLVALPLLPIWVWTAVRGWDARLLSLYPLGALMVVGLHLADTLPDIPADAQHGVRGLAHRLGERRALLVCWLCSLLPPFLATGAAAVGMAALQYVAPAAALSLFLTGAAIVYYTRARRRDWRPHFALLAAAAIVLCLGWLLALR